MRYSTGTSSNRSSRLLACALLALLLAPAAWLGAQGVSPLTVDALLGFNGLIRPGRMAPLLVSVENTGRKLDAEVSVAVSRGSELRGTLFTRTFTRKVTLGASSARQVSFTVPIDRNPSSLVVSVSAQGKVLARREMDLRGQATSSRLVAAISSELSLDYLSGLSDAGGELRVAYPRIDDLPDTWAGYDGVELVVVHDTYFQSIGAVQASALQEWVVSGGSVVFCGGAAALQLASAGLGSIVPVEIDGLTERTGLPSLGALARARSGPGGRIVLASSRLLAGSVVAAEGDLPVVVERRLGKGAVWFLAFDPGDEAFASWPGALPLWRLIGESARQPILGATDREALDDPWMQALLKSQPLAFPTGLVSLAFIGGYVGLLLIPGLRRTGFRGGPWARALILLVMPVVASVTGYVLFNQVLFRPSPFLVVGSKIEVTGDADLGLATEELGLFSSGSAAPTIALARRDVVVNEITPPLIPQLALVPSQGAAEPQGYAVELGADTTLREVALDRYASRLFTLNAVVRIPVRVSLQEQGSSIHVTLSNGSDRTLGDCFLTLEGRGYPMGMAAAGQTLERSFQASEGLDLSDPALLSRLAGGERRSAFWQEVYGQDNHGATAIAGWLDRPAIPLSAGGDLARQAPLSLLVVEIP